MAGLMKAWPGRRIWAVLEPRSNTMRRKIFQDRLPAALAKADRVILGGVHRAALLGDEQRLDPAAITDSIKKLGKVALALPNADEIAALLTAESQPGDILLIMSNGSFDGLCEKLVKNLSAKYAATGVNSR